MAAPILISTVLLTPGSSATPGAQAITVPADAQGVVVFTRAYLGPTLSLTSDFAGTFTIVQDTGNEITSVSYAAVTSTGSKNLTPSWSAGPSEGPLFIVAFVKNIDNSSIAAWVRDSDALANDVVGSSFGLTVDSTADDLVLALDSQYNTGLTVPANESGWTSIATQGVANDAGRLRSADSPGASTTTATTQGTQYRGIAIVSLIGAAGAATLTPPLLTQSKTLYAPAVTGGGDLAIFDGAIFDSVIFDTGDTGGGTTLTPGLLTRTKTLYAPTVTVGAITVTPGLLTRGKTLYAPTVSQGAVQLTPPLLTRGKTLYAPSVIVGTVTLTPGLLTRGKTLYAPTVTVGAITLTPGLLTRSKTLYGPIVTQAGGPQILAPGLLTRGKTLYAPTVSTGSVSITPGLLTRGKVLYAPTITVGGVTLTPSLFTQNKILYFPTVTGGDAPVDAGGLFWPIVRRRRR